MSFQLTLFVANIALIIANIAIQWFSCNVLKNILREQKAFDDSIAEVTNKYGVK